MAQTSAAAAPSQRGATGRRSPPAEEQQHHDDQPPASHRHDPAADGRVAMALLRVGHDQKPEEPGTQEGRSSPGPGGDAITQPEHPEGQREDQLGHQDGLHGGQLSEVQRQRGEHEGAAHGEHPQQPHRLPDEIEGRLPGGPLLLLGPGHVGQALEHRRQCLAERAGQGEQNAHRAGPRVSLSCATPAIRDQGSHPAQGHRTRPGGPITGFGTSPVRVPVAE